MIYFMMMIFIFPINVPQAPFSMNDHAMLRAINLKFMLTAASKSVKLRHTLARRSNVHHSRLLTASNCYRCAHQSGFVGFEYT